jgi:hypothetical protein
VNINVCYRNLCKDHHVKQPMKRPFFKSGNTKEFNEKLLVAFQSIKSEDSAKTLFNLFTFHSGHATNCIPTRRWCKHILLHLNTINKFPGHSERLPLRMTAHELEIIMQKVNN